MNKNTRLMLGVIICVAGLIGEPAIASMKGLLQVNKPDVVVVVDDTPSLEFVSLVSKITATDITKEDADLISCFYTELSDIIANDTEFVKNTGQFREFNMTAGKLYFGTKLKNKYANLGEDIDEAIVGAIGRENVSIDSSKRQKLVDVLKAIAWSVKQ